MRKTLGRDESTREGGWGGGVRILILILEEEEKNPTFSALTPKQQVNR